ncbi:hypothetical protein ACIREE_27820 [Streptomyces sp. NPDC102467]
MTIAACGYQGTGPPIPHRRRKGKEPYAVRWRDALTEAHRSGNAGPT